MKTFIGTKVIKAIPMNRGEYNKYRGWAPPDKEDQSVSGYLVEYTDGGPPNDARHEGYISWSPKEQFDNAYREQTGLTFGMALEAIKIGKRIARAGWNGKDMFVYFVGANHYPAQTEVACNYFGEETLVPYNAYMALKGVDETISTWAPSGSDALAEDWMIV